MDHLVELEPDDGGWHAHELALQQYREESLQSQKGTKTMGLTVKETGGGANYEPAPAGAHVARCYRIVDLGTQITTYKGESKQVHQILITWELPTALMKEGEAAGKPYSVNQRFTCSIGEKAKLRAVLESWRGRKFSPQELAGFDLQNILGKPCMLNIVHTDKGDKTYANIATVMQVPSGMVVPPQVNKSVFFSLETFDAAVFSSLPESLQENIKKAPEYLSAVKGEAHQVELSDGGMETLDDDIPF